MPGMSRDPSRVAWAGLFEFFFVYERGSGILIPHGDYEHKSGPLGAAFSTLCAER